MDHDRAVGIITRDRVTHDLHLDYPHYENRGKEFPSSRDDNFVRNKGYFEILDLWREVQDRRCN